MAGHLKFGGIHNAAAIPRELGRPALFFGNNPISLAGGAITSAAGVTMIAYWLVEFFGRPNDNPYLGIIFFLMLPAAFYTWAATDPCRRVHPAQETAAGGPDSRRVPKIDLNDRMFRHGLDIVLVATIVNLLVVSMASYRGAAYMDSPQFCGASCHVMHPEYTAYKVSAHSHVACVECHIGSGAQSYFEAKVNGTKQLVEVAFNRYPKPIPSPVRNLRPAREICEACHTPARFVGEKLLVKSSFADDEKNTETQSVVVLHLGGVDSFSHLTGIHGVHLGHIEYIATDPTRTAIPWVERTYPDGSKTAFAASALKGAEPKGERRVMDCIDCHNRAAHTMQTAEDALNRAMAEGAISPELPWVHKKALELLKASYATEAEATRQDSSSSSRSSIATNIPDVLAAHPDLVKSAGEGLVYVFTTNVFPDMKVTWGTHPNHIGHMSYPGCFRCHDGDHASKDGTNRSRRTAPPATTCSPWTKQSQRCFPISAFNKFVVHRLINDPAFSSFHG